MSLALNADYITPAELTGMIRTALADLQINQFTLSRWLPNVTIDDIAFRFSKGQRGLAEAAVYRSWDAESPIGRREGLQRVMGELPPISEKILLTEYDRIRLRRLDNGDELLPFIARDAQRLAQAIAARFELARGDALVNGSVTIDENGVTQTISFGRSGSHAVTANVLWSNHDTAVPIDDMESWVQTYIDDNGGPPGVILMPRACFADLRACDQIRNQVFPLAPSAPVVSAEQLRNVFDSLDLPPIELYDAQVKVDGSAARITPNNKILLLPAPGSPDATEETDLGGTVLGTTAEAAEPEYGIEGDQPGVVAAQYKSLDPVHLWTHAAAVGVPILKDADLTFVATVR